MGAELGRLHVKGLASIRDVTVDFTSDVTVLIGANGAGKSNLVSALELVARIWDGTFQEYLRSRGGISNLRFEGPGESADSIFLEVVGTPQDNFQNGYRARLTPTLPLLGDTDVAELEEWLLFQGLAHYNKPFDRFLGSALRSRVPLLRHDADDLRLSNFVSHVAPILDGCRVFHFDDVSPTARVQTPCDVADNLALHRDASNIAAYLYRIKTEEPTSYEQIVGAIQQVTPFFDDFVLVPSSLGKISLRWKQRGLDRVFAAHEASDGTLRFICLATLLLGPDLPATVVLDEPELGLHPAAISLLAEITKAAGTSGHRIVLATQSVPLVSCFDLSQIVVLQRENGATSAHHPDEAQLEHFLEDYSVGNLWEMNLLGGTPAPEVTK